MMRLCTGDTQRFIAKCIPADRQDDRGAIERRWAAIYAANSTSSLYNTILKHIPKGFSILEMGCSAGNLQYNNMLMGVDISFPALIYAKRKSPNVRYVLADINQGRFSTHDVVVALNMLDVVEPHTLLNSMISHAAEYIVLSDPYDYSRGDSTVKTPMDSTTVREHIQHMGFQVSDDTAQPSFVPWEIRINSRTSVRYLVDIVVAKRV